MNEKTMDNVADDLSILYGFFYLLNREPETRAVIEEGLSVQRTIRQLRHDIIMSDEYKSHVKLQAAESVWRNIMSTYLNISYQKSNFSNNVLVMSTCDPYRYFDMFVISSGFNRRFCKSNDLLFQSFIGLKRGFYPHHAMLNRVHMLKELVDGGYRGWVLYLDADCIVMDPAWEIKEELLSLRSQQKMMLVHNVRDPNDPIYHWWDVNTGSFAIDLSANLSRHMVNCWSFLYSSIYSFEDYTNATRWDDIINDQTSLHYLLRFMEKYVDIKNHVESISFHNYINENGEHAYPISSIQKILQSLRSTSTDISTDQALKIRASNLLNHGNRIWSLET